MQYRRIGTILLERGLIDAGELDLALKEQSGTGRPLGEICVERYGLDRLSLADALAEQWEEMQRATAATDLELDEDQPDEEEAELSPEEELRALLEEAQAARAELESKTDELSRRLAALETLVVGVTSALAELRPAAPVVSDAGGNGRKAAAAAGATRRTKRSRQSPATA